ncbi:MAG: HlyD family secretion protein [Rhodoplanes sp.]|jgi:multidrug resistance efflux pump|nr:HlyD family efflux transporter periplasmic adaptor subunit [Rhodoplanes sp.]
MMATTAAPAIGAPAQLRASTLAWRRLRRIVMLIGFVAVLGGLALYFFPGGGLFFNADGLVFRDHITVSAPYDARIKQVLVRPGDHVDKGQTIAIVESASIYRTLAELSAERARVGSRVAQLEARQKVVGQLLPIAEESANQAKAFLDELSKAGAKGLTVSRSLQEISAAHFTASERVFSLQAEQESLQTELRANKSALDETNLAYDHFQQTYEDGVLRAPVAGYIGGAVASQGEGLVPGKDRVAQIFTGKSFVLAFMPETYLFDVEAGESVAVKARGKTVTGTIQKILPVTEALPPEFQLPGKARNRGQVVRIALQDPDQFAVEEKVRVSGCLLADCSDDLVGLVKSFFSHAQSIAKHSILNVPQTRSAGRPPASAEQSE